MHRRRPHPGRVIAAALGGAVSLSALAAAAQTGGPADDHARAPAPADPGVPGSGEVDRLLALVASARTLDEAIEARARLIDAAGEDERAPTWMVEQAAAVLDRLSVDGSDAAVLLGIPTPRQRQSAEQAAGEALALTARADDAAARIVARVQNELIAAGSARGRNVADAVRRRAEEAERTLVRLVDVEQAVRIPFFRGRAAVLLTALEPAREAREEFARVALESMGRLRLGTVAAEASRRVALGAVLVWISEGGGANGQPRSQAAELFRWVVEQPVRGPSGDGDPALAPDPVTRAQAWMGLFRTAETAEDLRAVRDALALAAITEPFVTVGASAGGPGGGRGAARAADPLLALLTAEAATRSMLRFVPAGGADRVPVLREAFAPMVALLQREDLREHRQSLRPLVLAKMGSATDRLMPFDELDPMVAFARAVTLARGAAPQDPRRDEAAALLDAVAARADAGSARAEALWELAVVLWESPRPQDSVRAVEALLHLATDFPDAPRAVEAAKQAVELSRYTLGQFAAGGGMGGGVSRPEVDAALRQRLGRLYERALETAVKLAPADPNSAQQRLERARIVLDAAASGNERAMTPEELDSALSALEGVPESDPRRGEADTLAVAAIDRALAAARSAVARAAEADRGGPPTLAPAARERHIAIARRAVQWSQDRRPRDADRYRLELAGALLDAGDARSATLFQDVASRAAAGSDMNLWSRLGLGRAQRAEGSGEAAFATLRALVDELERAAASRRPPSPQRHEVYWLAWAEMLEILADDNRDGRRTEVIRLQINRLSLVDPGFGGGEGGKRIDAVRAAIR